MLFWMKKKPVPENHIPITPVELDDILTIMRYWYGIEVDNWINSEASKYEVILQISDFGSSRDMERLHQYYIEAINQAKQLKGSSDPHEKEDFDGTFGDFLGVEVKKISGKNEKDSAVVVNRVIPACRIHYPVKNWFFFTDEKQYNRCDIDFYMKFRPFGEKGEERYIRFELRVLEEDKLAITRFEANKRVMDKNFDFLTFGLKVLNEIDERILEKYRDGKRADWSSLEKENWFFFECLSEEEAKILNGVNESLEIESYQKGKIVEFKMQEHDIPGLISYVRAGLPHQVFAL